MRDVLSFLPYLVRSVTRARARTTLTVLGAALAMGLFAFVRSMDEGVSALFAESGERVLVVFQESRFCPMTSEIPLRYNDAIRGIDGVAEALPTLVFVNSCRSNLDLVTLHGVPDGDLSKVHEFDFVAGTVAAFRARSDGAIIGERLAKRRGAEVGERLRLGPVDVHVSAILRGDDPGIEDIAFVSIDQLGLARQRPGMATQFYVTLRPGADPEVVARAIDARFQTDVVHTQTRTRQAFVSGAVAEIAEVLQFARYLGYLAVVVVALILANTQFISTQARRPELSALEAIGLPRREIRALIMMESVLLAIVGGGLGALLVATVLYVHPVTLGVEGHGIDFRPSVLVLVQSLLAAAMTGLLAAIPSQLSLGREPVAHALTME